MIARNTRVPESDGVYRSVALLCYLGRGREQGTTMATTTTIRIDDELKSRVAVAAEIAGKTIHAFILDAISETVEQV